MFWSSTTTTDAADTNNLEEIKRLEDLDQQVKEIAESNKLYIEKIDKLTKENQNLQLQLDELKSRDLKKLVKAEVDVNYLEHSIKDLELVNEKIEKIDMKTELFQNMFMKTVENSTSTENKLLEHIKAVENRLNEKIDYIKQNNLECFDELCDEINDMEHSVDELTERVELIDCNDELELFDYRMSNIENTIKNNSNNIEKLLDWNESCSETSSDRLDISPPMTPSYFDTEEDSESDSKTDEENDYNYTILKSIPDAPPITIDLTTPPLSSTLPSPPPPPPPPTKRRLSFDFENLEKTRQELKQKNNDEFSNLLKSTQDLFNETRNPVELKPLNLDNLIDLTSETESESESLDLQIEV